MSAWPAIFLGAVVAVPPLLVLGGLCWLERLSEGRRIRRCREHDRAAGLYHEAPTGVLPRLPGGQGRPPTSPVATGCSTTLVPRHIAVSAPHGEPGDNDSGQAALAAAVWGVSKRRPARG